MLFLLKSHVSRGYWWKIWREYTLKKVWICTHSEHDSSMYFPNPYKKLEWNSLQEEHFLNEQSLRIVRYLYWNKKKERQFVRQILKLNSNSHPLRHSILKTTEHKELCNTFPITPNHKNTTWTNLALEI